MNKSNKTTNKINNNIFKLKIKNKMNKMSKIKIKINKIKKNKIMRIINNNNSNKNKIKKMHTMMIFNKIEILIIYNRNNNIYIIYKYIINFYKIII